MGELSVFCSALVYLGSFFITIQNMKRVVSEKTSSKHRNSKKVILGFLRSILAAFPFILVYGLRFQVGVDYKAYLVIYNYLKDTRRININSNLELGYVALNLFAGYIFQEGYGIFIVVGILLTLLLYKLIKQYQNEISVPLLLYCFFMVYFGVSCNAVRQMLAVMLCVNAYRYVIDRKPQKYILCILIATLFHKSAIFCILLYFLVYIKSSAGIILFKAFCCLIGLSCIVFQNQILSFMAYIKWYSGYFDRVNNGIGIRGLAFLLYVVPILILIGLTQSNLINKKKNYQFLVLLMWLQIPIQCCGVFNPVIERMSLYCSIAQIILVPAIVKSIKDTFNRKIWEYVFKAWYLFYFIVMDMYLAGNGIKNYQLWRF